jgi:dTMP kinase
VRIVHSGRHTALALLVAIEGIDGSGKGTQARRLVERLAADGRRTTLISFPRYEATLFGRAVGDFLNGRFGALDQVSPFLASLLYAGDRFESKDLLLEAIEKHDVVVLDRYVASNVAHQGSKLDGNERHELIEWIRRIEYDVYRLPQPDLVLLLDLPAAEAQRLIARKQARSYTDLKADLQEADGGYLEKVRAVYLELSAREPGWRRIECVRGGAIRSIDDIGEEVWRVVNAAGF